MMLFVLTVWCATAGAVAPYKNGAILDPDSKTYTYLENNLVRIAVEDLDGSFGIGTSSVHPTRPCLPLLYGYSCAGNSSTSRINVNVDGAIWLVAGYHSSSCTSNYSTYVSTVINGGSIESRWTIPSPPLSVLVKHTAVDFGSGNAGVLTETFVTNNDGTAHNIGVLYEYDTMVAANDAAELAAGGAWYPYETCVERDCDALALRHDHPVHRQSFVGNLRRKLRQRRC